MMQLTVVTLVLLLSLTAAATAQAPKPAPGGAGPRASTEGCVGEWLFNGVWRVRVQRQDTLTSPRAGWGLTTEFRNGTSKTINLHGTGVTPNLQLVLADGTIAKIAWMDFADVYYRRLPPGGAAMHQLKFFAEGAAGGQGASKLLIEVDTAVRGPVRYTVKNPSLRVRLDCQR